MTTSGLAFHKPPKTLSKAREARDLLASGKTYKEVADHFKVSPRTVERWMQEIRSRGAR